MTQAKQTMNQNQYIVQSLAAVAGVLEELVKKDITVTAVNFGDRSPLIHIQHSPACASLSDRTFGRFPCRDRGVVIRRAWLGGCNIEWNEPALKSAPRGTIIH